MLHIFYSNLNMIKPELKAIAIWLAKQKWPSQAEQNFLKAQIKGTRKKLRRVRRQNSFRYSNKKLHSLQYKLLNSHSYIATAILAVFKQIEKRAKQKGQKGYPQLTSMKQLNTIAEKVKSQTKLVDPIKLQEIDKSDGSKRIVCTFDVIGQVQSKIAEWIFLICSPPNEYSFCIKGQGTHSAIEKIPTYLKNGFRYWVVFDIKNAFPSVRRGHLLETASISTQVCRLLLYPVKSQTLNEVAQPSLPPGIASSPKIMSAVVGQPLRQLDATNLVIMSYLDDILIGAQTMGELEDAIETLHKGCEKHSAGPLHLKQSKVVDIKKAGIINFLGYAISLDKFDGKIRVRPNIVAFSKFLKELTGRLHEEYQFSSSCDNFNTIATDYGEYWKAGFKLWQPNAFGIELFAATIEIAVTHFMQAGCDPEMALKTGYYHAKLELSAI